MKVFVTLKKSRNSISKGQVVSAEKLGSKNIRTINFALPLNIPDEGAQSRMFAISS